MHEQLPVPHGVAVKDIALLIARDVHGVDKELAVLYLTKGVLQIDLAGTNALDFRSAEGDARLIPVFDEIVMEGFAIIGNALNALLDRQ